MPLLWTWSTDPLYLSLGKKPDKICNRCSLLDWLVLEWRLMPRKVWKNMVHALFSYTFIAPTQQSPISCQQKTLPFSRERPTSLSAVLGPMEGAKILWWNEMGTRQGTAGKPAKPTEFDMWGGHYVVPSRLMWFLGTGKVTRFFHDLIYFPLVWSWLGKGSWWHVL